MCTISKTMPIEKAGRWPEEKSHIGRSPDDCEPQTAGEARSLAVDDGMRSRLARAGGRAPPLCGTCELRKGVRSGEGRFRAQRRPGHRRAAGQYCWRLATAEVNGSKAPNSLGKGHPMDYEAHFQRQLESLLAKVGIAYCGLEASAGIVPAASIILPDGRGGHGMVFERFFSRHGPSSAVLNVMHESSKARRWRRRYPKNRGTNSLSRLLERELAN